MAATLLQGTYVIASTIRITPSQTKPNQTHPIQPSRIPFCCQFVNNSSAVAAPHYVYAMRAQFSVVAANAHNQVCSLHLAGKVSCGLLAKPVLLNVYF